MMIMSPFSGRRSSWVNPPSCGSYFGRARRFAHALGGAPRRRRQQHLAILGLQDLDDAVDDGGFADARTAGDDGEFRGKGFHDGLLLRLGQLHPGFFLDPVEGLEQVDRRQFQLGGAQVEDQVGRAAFALAQAGQIHHVVLDDHFGGGRQPIDGVLDGRNLGFEQFGGGLDEPVARQTGVAVVGRVLQRVPDARLQPMDRVFGDAQPGRNTVGGLEPDAGDVLGEPIRVLLHESDGVFAVLPVNLRGMRAADAVALQENHDVAHALLRRPRVLDAFGAFGPDAVHFPEPGREVVDDLERLFAESLNDAVGKRFPDALDQSAAEVLLDADDGPRQHAFEFLDGELAAELFVRGPAALGADGFAHVECGEVADDGDGLGPAPGGRGFGDELRDGVMVLLVGVHDAFDRAFDRFQGL